MEDGKKQPQIKDGDIIVFGKNNPNPIKIDSLKPPQKPANKKSKE